MRSKEAYRPSFHSLWNIQVTVWSGGSFGFPLLPPFGMQRQGLMQQDDWGLSEMLNIGA